MISMGIMSGMRDQTGPRNCLKYFMPWICTPTMCVRKKTTRAMATVVFRLAVGDSNPGMRPMRFENRMKKPMVAMSGKNFFPCSPMVSIRRLWKALTNTSMTFWTLFG